MMACIVILDEYIATLLKSLEKLIPHSLWQSTFLKETKAKLGAHEAIVLLDFSKNFSCVIQDEGHGYHWTKASCTFHAAVIYTKISCDSLSVNNVCNLSDDMHHDVTFVYLSQ